MKKTLLFLSTLQFCISAQTIDLVYDFPSSFSGSNIVTYNDKLIFQGKSSNEGLEIWTSDGTTGGTTLLKDNFAGSASGTPDFFINALGKVLFQTYNSSNYEPILYITDGTASGTVALKSLCEGPYTYEALLGTRNGREMNGKFYYCAKTLAEGMELFVTDGTPEGTHIVKDINPGTAGSAPQEMAVLNGKLYFSANNGTNGAELWVSDGTELGTVLVKDIKQGSGNSAILYTTVFNNNLYFQADNGVNAKELWRSDGTPDGTFLLKDIYPGGNNYEGLPNNFVVYNNKLYFAANNAAARMELWVTDGTSEGTVLVKDINPGGILSSNPGANSGMLVHGDKLYFGADVYSVSGRELMYYDAAVNDVLLLKDLNPGTANSNIYEMKSFGNQIVFSADSSGFSAEQVWLTDGTKEGTKKVKYPGTVNTSPTITGFTILNNAVYFYSNYKGGSGTDLYKLTDLVTDISDENLAMEEAVYFPNPVSSQINILNHTDFNTYKIYDLSGKMLAKESLSSDHIEVTYLKAGTYLLEVLGENGAKKIQRFVKQ